LPSRTGGELWEPWDPWEPRSKIPNPLWDAGAGALDWVLVAFMLGGVGANVCGEDCRVFAKDAKLCEDDSVEPLSPCWDTGWTFSAEGAGREAGEGAVVLEAFGVESTKVVSRNCPNDDVPPDMTLAWPPLSVAILICTLSVSYHRIVLRRPRRRGLPVSSRCDGARAKSLNVGPLLIMVTPSSRTIQGFLVGHAILAWIVIVIPLDLGAADRSINPSG